MRKIAVFSVLLLSVTATACTWVKLEPQARQIRVAAADVDLSGCERRGEVAVAVKDGVGPVSRNDLKVRDELETLARNEALGLQADTVQAKGEPSRGQQRFLAYRCGGAVPAAATRRDAEPVEQNEDGVEVFRIE
ncbi:DUF4156 domain-containing protein [Alkalisalibacterium limincola]|uniref:DUF4156 domain-containing protein n=1 Tax=Alkalisalibacterium limincola TaxID=2699169 RepID=A0A5C8KN84_9GAMM|nr:DUF4156 domain-containing protein [Alkalisalibacterium limincola]